jgi:hypothetical protein
MMQARHDDSPVECAVARAVVNIFREASTEGEVVSQAIYGNSVLAEGRRAGWACIRTADGYRGWTESAGLLEFDLAPYAPEGKTVQVSSLMANLYRDPDVVSRPPLLQLPWEARLELPSDNSDGPAAWLKVRLVDGQLAWVQKGDVVPQLPVLTVTETLQIAHRFIGITYTWGGVSSFGFDCSGFTQMLMRQRGILMPRNADQQAAWSNLTAIESENVEPGDLLFFGSDETRINHTGMYLGDCKFIHATAHCHPGVQVSSLDKSPWAATLLAARRAK